MTLGFRLTFWSPEANTVPALYRMTPRVWNKSIAESKLDHLHGLPLCSEGKAVYVSLFNDWQSHGNLKPDGVRALIPNSHVQMGALRSKISQKASSSQSSTRSTLSRCHTSQEIQVSARPIAEPQGSWILPYRLCQVESLDSKETFPLREKKKSPHFASAELSLDIWLLREQLLSPEGPLRNTLPPHLKEQLQSGLFTSKVFFNGWN